MRRTAFLAFSSLAAITFSAYADEIAIKQLPKRGTVMVFGTVQQIKNDGEFILRDDSGSIHVKINTGVTSVLDEGDSVTVTGDIRDDDIEASDVELHQRATS